MLWGITLHPGEEFTRKVLSDEHLTLASLECRADKSIDGGRPNSCLLLKTGRGQHVLCTLEEGVTNQQCLDLILEQGEKITFLVEGTGIVYLTGFSSTKRQRELSWPIRDYEGNNTGFNDSFQGETDILSQKDVSDDEDVMQEVSGSHGDCEGTQSDNDGNYWDNDGNRGDDDCNRGDNDDDCVDENFQGKNGNYPNYTGKDHSNKSIVKDGYSGSVGKMVIEGGGDTIVKGNTEPGNRDHGENDNDGLNLAKQDGEADLLQKVMEETLSKNIIISARSKKSNASVRAKSLRITSSRQEKDDGSSMNTGVYRCFICLESFVKKADCAAHEDICDKGNLWKRRHKEPHRCKFCGRAFDKPSHKRQHEKIHTKDRPYACKYCEKKFTNMYSAKKHENGHTRKDRYKCQLCPKTYMSNFHLEEHMRSHTGEKPFQCPMCMTFFSTSYARNRHIRRHKIKNMHQCQKCGKGFSSEKKLERHDKIHTEEEKYSCRHCDVTFVKNCHRLRHEKMAHPS